MTLQKWLFLSAFGLVLIGMTAALPGCSGSTSQKVAEEPVVVPTATETLRTALTNLAASGEKDSGTELLKGEIEQLRGTPG
ncbi:MAG TPA: hypothetical protein VFG20_03065, partial [Planctomycetaceae bacterium]|nr:hypothetical protein [Planctomycetaceae bacterium]